LLPSLNNQQFPNHSAVNPEKKLNRQVAKGAKEDS
jgi:hypothetical protein